VAWWHDAVTSGSDAHEPDLLARQFRRAAAVAEACGFIPGRTPHDPRRRG
jgi:histidinol-phosphatase (PHP family)